MADQQPIKKSKGFLKHLKKLFRPGSQSIPLSRSNTPPANLATVTTLTTNPEEAANLRAKYTNFRILVIGRANAGKTTLLKRVCNTMEDPVYSKINPTSERGIHNVYEEFSFKSNPQFIFHDSPGFEAGGEQELQDVLSFLQEKAKAKEVMDQIHAIWFCFTPDVSRPLLGLEQRFFNEKLAGNVPVVAIFTKFDDLITQVYDRVLDDEENIRVACATLENKFEKPLKGYRFPPRAYVRFESIHENEGNHQEQVGELIKQTAASIDDLALKMLFVTVQQNNLEVCIEYAVNKNIFQYTSSVWDLIYSTTTWFGHCYQDHDYGETENPGVVLGLGGGRRLLLGGGRGRGRRRGGGIIPRIEDFANNFHSLVKTQFDAPSLCSFIAILICLEHSFWNVQQGSDLVGGFIKAWEGYLKTLRVLVDQELDNYLRSKGSNDWFTTKHCPSSEELAEYKKMVLKNLLSRPKTST